MKSLLRAIYVFLTGPLYRRLSHEMSVKLQAQVDAQLHFEETFVQQTLDELVVLSIRLEEQNRLLQSVVPDSELSRLPEESLAESGLSDAELVQLIHEAQSGKGLYHLASRWNISPLLAAKLKARLFGVGDHSLGLVRSLERENARLTRALSASNSSFDPRDAQNSNIQLSTEAR